MNAKLPTTLLPIHDADLPQVCGFLNHHLNPRIPPTRWAASFLHPWMPDKPNNGWMLKTNDTNAVVGVIGAIYSARTIRGKPERFCNLNSWCVLREYGNQSLDLLATICTQPNLHFTTFTPAPHVATICQFLRFQYLNPTLCMIPTAATLFPSNRECRILTDPHTLSTALSPETAQIHHAHRDFHWFHHLALGTDNAFCYIILKATKWKKLPAAFIYHISDPEIFLRHYTTLCRHLLFHHKIATLHLPVRLLGTKPPLGFTRPDPQPRMFLSTTLHGNDVSYLYSELMALDL